ncbi:MAG: CARDB domain-containing protein [Candidatus Bathyarchaeia archaeon]|jgi:hypothetical protein
MMQRRFIVRFIMFFLLSCTACFIGLGKPLNVHAILQSAEVGVSPSSITISVNQNFTIDVDVSGVSDPYGLYGWEFILTWNSSLLDAVNVTEGPFLKAGGGSTFFASEVNVTDGSMKVDCTLTGDANGVTGDGTLASITFYVYNSGGCPLHLSEAILVNSQGQPIQTQAPVDSYGYFTVSADVAVTGIDFSRTTVVAGGIVNINVTVRNQGGFDEAFDVTVYVNSQVIGMQPVSLPSGSSIDLSFTWNTVGIPFGNYTIKAYASPVPDENDTTNNAYSGGWVAVTIPGDLNGDFKVGLQDLVLLALAYGSKPGDLHWNPNADIDNSGAVGLSDLAILALHYGQQWP